MNRPKLPTLALASLASLLLASTVGALPGEVWKVDDSGGADFTDIQPAIDAADHGDTILVRPGSYGGFTIVDKSLSLVVDGGQSPRIRTIATIAGLAADHPVTLAGLNLRRGLVIIDSDGEVLCSDLVCEWPELTTSNTSLSHRVSNCETVVFSRCSLKGRDGAMVYWNYDTWDGVDGENGLDVQGSRVALYGCQVQGGTGGDCIDGNSWVCEDARPSSGGDGIEASANSYLYVDDTVATGGPKGYDDLTCSWDFPPGEDGVDVRLLSGSTTTSAAAPVISLAGTTLVRANDQASLEISGPAGAPALLLWADGPHWRELGPVIGPLHLSSQGLHAKALGTIPGSGVLSASFTPPALLPGEENRRLFVQAFVLGSGTPGRLLGTPSSLDVVDPMF